MALMTDCWPAAADHEIHDIGPGHVGGGHADATGGAEVEGQEAVFELVVRPGEDFDVGIADRGSGDNVGFAVAVHVADGHVDAAGEFRIVGEERSEFLERSAVERLNVRAATGPGPGDDVG